MTSPATPGEMLLDACRGASRALLVAPYIKANALRRVLGELQAATELVCVTRWIPHDVALGASDVACRALTLEVGGHFLLHPALHAKYYRLDETTLVGSANLTDAAMGWSAQPNLEILTMPSRDFDATEFERSLLQDAREISEAEFAVWASIEQEHAPNNTVSLPVMPQLDDWRPATRDPRHIELSYYGRGDDIASFDEQRLARQDIAALAIPPGLSEVSLREWVAACLLSARFPSAVLRIPSDTEHEEAGRELAQAFTLELGQAWRDMETAQNWLRVFAPGALPP